MPGKKQEDYIAMLARKWMDGTITGEEMADFERWYQTVDDAEPEVLSNETPEALRERLYGSILLREPSVQTAGQKRPGRYRYLAAACIVLLAFFSFWWVQNRFDAAPFTRLVEVRAGERIQKAILPDGSLVWLRPGAMLRYPSVFGEKREVTLTGEGLFEVSKDPARPFTVSVGGYTATVLGTSFYIRQLRDREEMVLAVLTGKVKVGREDGRSAFESRVVLPDEKILTGAGEPVVSRLTAAESRGYVSGTDYDMNFNDTPFSEVVERIEKKFDVHIKGDLPRYASCHFTADLTDEGLDYTLELLARSAGIDYRREDDLVFFEGGGCDLK